MYLGYRKGKCEARGKMISPQPQNDQRWGIEWKIGEA
jgi:hypothetical protein